jgi:HPt (histidine-containing phosphotransfer) domain-containing protein
MAELQTDAVDTVPLDLAQLLHRCMGNLALAERLLASFEKRLTNDVSAISKSMAEQNSAALVRTAHQLKGASANMSAPGLQRAAAAIEDLGRQNRLGELAAELEQLRHECQRFITYKESNFVSSFGSREG